jgi:2-amino-4-hydroxy-6-hydroxymethyldihydropteridine diphosphokinase/dihydropteroate synthase
VKLKRKKIIDKGPRTLDLDILLYDDLVMHEERLIIPHPLMLEREFVLRPLCDIIPDSMPPLGKDSYETLLNRLLAQDPDEEHPLSLTYASSTFPISPATVGSKSLTMAILNLTPDSFSDGGLHSPSNRSYLTSTIKNMINSGASIIDIGGESTRPGSLPIGAEEEIARILPAVRIAAEQAHWNSAIVSVDTYRAAVADTALRAGADMINDISAGALDPDMLSTVAKHGKSIVLMHTRGTPQNMFSDPSLLDYGSDIVATVTAELLVRVEAAQAAGIPRWRILVDPGFGFAKTYEQNVELLDRLSELRNHSGLKGLPWVIGVSRKRFVRGMAGYDPETHKSEESIKVFAEQGTVMALKKVVKGGAEVLRVHDVPLVKRLLEGIQ